jgi:hypothetical protein
VGENGITTRELMEAIYDIRDRVTRMEEKLNRADKIEDKADEANAIANKALALAEENHRDIEGIRKAVYWGFGFIITLGITLIVELIKK